MRFSLKLLSRLLQKVIKYYIEIEKKTDIAKPEIFTFMRKSAELQCYAFDKINRNCAFYGNSINIHLLVFLHAEFISAMKTVQNPTVFIKTQK